MASILSYSHYFQFGLRNVDVIQDAADTAVLLKQAKTYVERVAILTPFLGRVAPKADELVDLIQGDKRGRGATEAMGQHLLALIHEELPMPRDARAPVRDRPWLNAGIEIFRQFVLPLLLQQLAQSGR